MQQEEEDGGRVSLLLELDDHPGALGAVLAAIAREGVNLTHIESRPGRAGRFDCFLDCAGSRDAPPIRRLLARLRERGRPLLVLDGQDVPWFPRRVEELDRVAGQVLGAGAELDADHPGFRDPAYRERRARIDALARAWRHGDPLPEVAYTEAETATWREVYGELAPLHATHGCEAFRRALTALGRECAYGPERIPQLAEVDAFLARRTGFRLRPAPGLMAPRDFLAGLAFRVFFSTQYVRHHSRPRYTPEPDVCHELIGHAPMFADPDFADLSQEIGLASLGAAEGEIERLARCYWFSVEFGLVREAGGLRAYGAGLLSSAGELRWACGAGDGADAAGAEAPGAEGPAYRPWDPAAAQEQDYPITRYQPLYYVADSLLDARERMRAHCERLPRPFHARLNPMTGRIWVDRAIRRAPP
jgi:phenylalanine-4-hydroxylase